MTIRSSWAGILALSFLCGAIPLEAQTQIASTPSAVSQGPGKINAFALDASGKVLGNYFENEWGYFSEVPGGGRFQFGPAAVWEGTTTLHVFVVDMNGNMRHQTSQNGAWPGTWENFSGQFKSKPAAVYFRGDVYVFGQGTDNYFWMKKLHAGTWTEWERAVNGPYSSGPGAAVEGDVLYVIGRGAADASAYVSSFTPQTGWSSDIMLKADIEGDPAITSWKPGEINVLVKSAGQVYHQQRVNGRWAGWSLVGGQVKAGPSGLGWQNAKGGNLMVWAWGTDGRMWTKTYVAGAWHDFEPVLEGPPEARKYIVDLTLSTASDEQTAKSGCPANYQAIWTDLNSGAGGKYIYACIKRGPKDQALGTIGILNRGGKSATTAGSNGNAKDASGIPKKLTLADGCSRGELVWGDLNAEAGGDYLYFCKVRWPAVPSSPQDGDYQLKPYAAGDTRPYYLTDIVFRSYSISLNDDCDTGGVIKDHGPGAWQLTHRDFYSLSGNSFDLNSNAGGKFVYLCIRGEAR